LLERFAVEISGSIWFIGHCPRTNLDHEPLRPPPVEFGGGIRATPLGARDTQRAMSQEKLELLYRAYDALNRRDLDAFNQTGP
jgi:hypothetical protein